MLSRTPPHFLYFYHSCINVQSVIRLHVLTASHNTLSCHKTTASGQICKPDEVIMWYSFGLIVEGMKVEGLQRSVEQTPCRTGLSTLFSLRATLIKVRRWSLTSMTTSGETPQCPGGSFAGQMSYCGPSTRPQVGQAFWPKIVLN